jgi:ABC-2 type transport system ATP-binding protein
VSEHAILIEGVEKYFAPAYSGWRSLLQPFARPTLRALARVSLSVEPGEVMALVGANGAGKSTLLRILATLIIPTNGRAFIKGFDVERERNRVLEKIGYHTGGDEGFYGRLSGRENLAFFAAMNNCVGADAARRIDHVAELMGIAETLDRQVRTFSTGMMHRLGLARAFLHAPPVLLLDEPTRSLDPLAAAEFRRFLRNDLVRRHGTTLLFASHTLSEVEQLADRVALLDAGRLLACDTPRGLRAATGAATLEQAFERLSRRAAKAAPAEALP